MHSSVSCHRTRTSSATVVSSTGPRTAAAPALSSASAEPSSLSPSFSDSDQLIVTMRIVDAQSASTALPSWRLADLGVRRRVGRQVPSLLARPPSVRASVRLTSAVLHGRRPTGARGLIPSPCLPPLPPPHSHRADTGCWPDLPRLLRPRRAWRVIGGRFALPRQRE